MASTVVIETSFSDLNNIEFSDIDCTLLKSLLEDSPIEGRDEEMSRYVIQSLEEEILDYNSMPETYEDCYVDDCPSIDFDLMDSSTSSDSLDFSWTRDYMTNYLMEHGVEEFVEIEDYSQANGLPLEEMGYISLWQETYQYTTYG